MITAEQLEGFDWVSEKGNRTIWFYGNWEYEFRVNSQELYNINDGVGEPQLIAKVTSIDELVKLYYALEGEEMLPIGHDEEG